MQYGIVIDENGFKLKFVALNEDKSPKFYELGDGESIIEEYLQIANDMNKPQWNGSEWIDTEQLPPEEIEPEKPDKNEIRIGELEQENKKLRTQFEALSTTTEFHEEVLVELILNLA